MTRPSRSPRERAHIKDGVGFKSGLSYVNAGVCEMCGEEYEIDTLCPSCENLRIMRLAYKVVIDLAVTGKLFDVMSKGQEAVPAFDDYYSLRDYYDEDEEGE